MADDTFEAVDGQLVKEPTFVVEVFTELRIEQLQCFVSRGVDPMVNGHVKVHDVRTTFGCNLDTLHRHSVNTCISDSPFFQERVLEVEAWARDSLEFTETSNDGLLVF